MPSDTRQHQRDPVGNAGDKDGLKHQDGEITPHEGKVDWVVGAARLTSAREPSDEFDLVLLDAFSSDNVPAHLLTVQAVQLYFLQIKPDGLLGGGGIVDEGGASLVGMQGLSAMKRRAVQELMSLADDRITHLIDSVYPEKPALSCDEVSFLLAVVWDECKYPKKHGKHQRAIAQ